MISSVNALFVNALFPAASILEKEKRENRETESPSHRARPGSEWFVPAALGLFAFLLFFYHLGSYPLFDPDEPRYAETARQMIIAHNHWITPWFNDAVRLDKPVLFYWMVAGIYHLIGVSEFSARFCSAGMATFTVLAIYGFARHWLSRSAGLFSAVILATALLFIGVGRMAITDMTLTAWMTGTTLCLFMAAHRHPAWWTAAGIFAGLGLLTKGPVGLVVPLGIFGGYSLLIALSGAHDSIRRVWLTAWAPLGLLLALGVALPWYLLAWQENGPLFINALFLHNVTRYSAVVSGHQQPGWYYGAVLLAGFMPWTPYLPAALVRLWRRARTNHRQAVARQDFSYLLALYAVIWAIFVFVFFSAAQTRLPTYILPMFPALALWLGETWQATADSFRYGHSHYQENVLRWLLGGSWALLLCLSAAGSLFILRMDLLLPHEARGIAANGFNMPAVALMMSGAALTVRLLHRRRLKAALLSQAAAIALTLVVALHGIIPSISRAAQGRMMHYLALSGAEPLAIYDLQRPGLTFYGRRAVPRFGGEDSAALVRKLRRHPRTFLITRNTRLNDLGRLLGETFQVRRVANDRIYSLLDIRYLPSHRFSPTGAPL